MRIARVVEGQKGTRACWRNGVTVSQCDGIRYSVFGNRYSVIGSVFGNNSGKSHSLSTSDRPLR